MPTKTKPELQAENAKLLRRIASLERPKNKVASESAELERLRTELLAAEQRQAATAEILNVIAASPSDVQPVFDAIAKTAMRLFDGQSSAVTRVVDGMVHLAAITSTSKKGNKALRAIFPVPVSHPVSRHAKVARTGKPTFRADYENDPDVLPKGLAMARARGFRSDLVVPLLLNGAPIGGLSVARREPGKFSKQQISLLESFAAQAVIAIENVRLFNETRESLAQQTATAEILKVISGSTTDTQPVFEAIVRNAGLLCDAGDAVLVLRDNEHGYAAANWGPMGSSVGRRFALTRRTIMGRSILDSVLLHVEDIPSAADFPEGRELAAKYGFRTGLSVPLLLAGGAIGAIVIRRPEIRPFNDKQIAMLESFAAQAVIAIENVRLFNETREALERQTATGEILNVISSSPTNVQPVFDTIAGSAKRLCNARECAIFTFDGDLIHLVALADVKAEWSETLRGAFPRPPNRGSMTARAIQTGGVVHVPDVWADPEYELRDAAQHSGPRCVLSVPMVRDGQVIGAITMDRYEPQAFLEREVSLLQTFADQAVIAIQNVRLFNETTEALEQQTGTAEILKVIARSPSDVQPVFDTIVRSAANLCASPRAALILFDGTMLHLASRIDDADMAPFEGMWPMPLERAGVQGISIREKAVVNVHDTESDPRVAEWALPIYRTFGIRSGLWVPMLREGQVIGLIVVFHPSPDVFAPRHTHLLETFADQAVIAIENVRLFNETKEGLERQTATADILKVIASSPSDVQPVFDAIAESAMRLLGGQSAAVTRVADAMLHLAAHTSTSESGNETLRRSFPRPLTGPSLLSRVIETNAPAFDRDVVFEPGRSDEMREMARERGYRSVLAVPMFRGEITIGTISVTRSEAGSFSQHQIALLQTFADQAVIAIENVRLFNETQEALERQTATADILKVIASSPSDVQPVFDSVAESAARLCRATDSTIVLKKGGQMVYAAHCGEIGVSSTGSAVPLTRGLASGRSLVDAVPVHLLDMQQETEAFPEGSANARKSGFRTILAIPMVRDGQAIGAIVIRRTEARLFGEKQIALLQTFADQAVIAIENVRLFNGTKESLERQTATSEVLRVIASSPGDVQPVFDTIAESALRLLKGQSATVTRIAGDTVQLAAITSTSEAGNVALRSLFPLPLSHAYSLHARVGRTGKPAVRADAENDPDMLPEGKEMARARGFRSELFVPMLQEGRTIGSISVARKEPGDFSDHQLDLLKTFADQAVIAIQNVRSFNETKEALEHQRASAEVLAVISSSVADTKPVFDKIADSAAQLFSGRHVGVVVLGQDGLLHLGAHRGPSGDEFSKRFPFAPGPESVVLTHRGVQFADVLNDPAVPARLRESCLITGAKAAMQCPMLSKGVGIGLLYVARERVGAFSDKEMALLQTFADQAVIAIQNVRSFKETKEALERQTATAEILKVIASSPSDVQPVLDAVAASSARLCDAADAVIHLRDGGYLRYAAHYGEIALAMQLGDTRQISQASVTGRVVLEGRLIHIHDLQSEAAEFPEGADMAQRAGFRTTLVTPLMRNGVAIGTISIRRTEVRSFAEAQVDLLKTFADQAVIAIENVRLFNETKEALERQTATAEILKVIASSPSDVQPVFDAIAESAKLLLRGHAASVTRVVGDALHLSAFTFTSEAGVESLRALFPMPLSSPSMLCQVAVRGTPAIRFDMEADPDVSPEGREAARRAGYRSALVVPMMREGVPIGTINVAREEAGTFSDHQIELLKTFADQAVIAVENVRLFNETKEALERQTATSDVLQVISSSPNDLRPVFDAVLRNATSLCDAHLGILNLFDGEKFETAAQRGGNPEFVKWLFERGAWSPLGHASLERMIAERQPIQVLDAKDSDSYREGKPGAVKWIDVGGARTFLYVPLIRDGKVIGNIGVYRPNVREFTSRQIALVKTFADQAVIAIENVRLFNETKEALERQTATAEVLKAISRTTFDLEPVLRTLLENASRLCNARDGVLWRLDPETNLLTASEFYQFSPDSRVLEILRSRPVPVDRSMGAGRAIIERRTVQIDDISLDAEYRKDVVQNSQTRSVLAVPMLRDGQPIGVIALANHAAQGPFTARQVDLVTTFADQAVIAIENVRLFNETTEALEQQTATAEILKVIGSSPTDVQPVFDAIVASAVRLFEPFNAVIVMREGEWVQIRAGAGDTLMNFEKAKAIFPLPFNPDTGLSSRVMAEARTLEIPDMETADVLPATLAFTRVAGFRSNTLVPLVREGVGIGAISLQHPDPGHVLTDKQMALVKTFADQAVIAIENVRLFNETKEALEQQTATAEILKVIGSSPTDTQPVFDAIVASALRIFDGMAVGVSLLNENQLELMAAGGHMHARIGFLMPLDGMSAAGQAIIERRAISIPDTEAPGALSRARENGRAAGFRSITAAPMLREGVAVGAIVVTRSEPGVFSDKHLQLLQTFADQAVIAIENVRLFKELESRTAALSQSVGQLTALGEVGNAISSTLDLDTVLQTIVARAIQLTGLDGGAIYEYDEQKQEFRLQISENMAEELMQAAREEPIRLGNGAVGRTAVTREPTQVPDTLDDSYHSERKELLIRSGYRAVLAVPLLREDNLLGALLVTRKTPGVFPEATVALLKTFATQSAMAIQNARLFREIAEKGKQLEIASHHKSDFLASMSHELRTPLNAILGFNELILAEIYGAVPEDMKEPLADIQSSGKHLLRLINNVLDLAKIEAGRMELALADYSVHDTVESVRSTLRPLAAEKGLEFLASVPEEIPIAFGDYGRITQCLMNLAGNSLKFTKQGKVEIVVGLKEGVLIYRVNDTGIGIPPDKIGNLFTEFKQTDATIASEYGGTGLGLSISKKFIEMHGGRVWVESEVGRGSSFIFEVPLRASAQKEAES